MNAPLHMSPFRRDGHLSAPGLEAIAVGLIDLRSAEIAVHLESCAMCRSQVDAHMQEVERTVLPPPPAFLKPVALTPEAPPESDPVVPHTELPQPANRRRWPTMLGGILGAASALFMMVPEAPTDGVRHKGQALSLDVFADEGTWSRRLGADDEVSATERLGFRVGTHRGGYIMVVGIDQDASPYLCYPQSDGVARWHEPGPAADLDEAIRLDGSAGAERVIGLLCKEPITYEEIVDDLVDIATDLDPDDLMPQWIRGCEQQEVRLVKRSKP